MRQTQKVLWTKGVLLTPQHLQTQDRFLEDLLEFRLSALTFSPWGFSRLKLDREALDAGTLAIADAAGILPDGLLFEIPWSDAVPPPLQVEDHWGPDQETLDVYLAIPEFRTGGHNVAAADQERHTRYLAEAVLRRDENTGLSEKPIQLARKNLRLMAEGESTDGATTLPVARVTRTESGAFQLDPHFVPPLVDIRASDYLLGIVRRLVEVLTARSTGLAGLRRQRPGGLADFGVSDIANFWLLYTVNTHLPLFRHRLETRRGHPAELFAMMLELAGALSTFSTDVHPRDLPVYAHADPGPGFAKLDEVVRRLLDTAVPTNYVTLPLRGTGPSVYAAAIDNDRYFEGSQFYLAMTSSLKAAELLRKAPQLLKISSGDQVERLIKQALPGLRISHAPSPPSALPVKLDYQYFQIDRAGAEWDAITLARNLAVYVPSDFPEPKLELVILLPEPGR